MRMNGGSSKNAMRGAFEILVIIAVGIGALVSAEAVKYIFGRELSWLIAVFVIAFSLFMFFRAKE